MNNQMILLKEERYCSVRESIKESFKEIKLMREGKKEKNSLQDLWKSTEEWEDEDDV